MMDIDVEDKGSKHQERIGALKIDQYAPNGSLLDMSAIGGLIDTDKDSVTWKFPYIIEIKEDITTFIY